MRILVASFALAVVCHCGGKESSSFHPTVPPDAASPEGGADSGDSGAPCYGSGHGPPSSPPLDSRPSPTTCPRGSPVLPDGGPAPSCNTDADCTGSNAGPHCVEHLCSNDGCWADSDCPSSQLCVCSDKVGGGIGPHYSQCVPAACHTDAECGAGNYCVASRGYCGSVVGYNCTSAHDTCVDPAVDCTSCGGGSCVYTPVVGHFVCATSTCNG